MQDVDVAYLSENRSELLRKFRGRWVVIHAGKLVGSWSTLGEAYEQGLKVTGSGNLMVQEMLTEDRVITMNGFAVGPA